MKRFVCSDIHGYGKGYRAMMKFLNKQGDYKLYFLGDAIDRGENGYDIMKALLDNPNVIYLRGNHENFLINSCEEFFNLCANEFAGYTPEEVIQAMGGPDLAMDYGNEMRLHMYNGGTPTFTAWVRNGFDLKIIRRLRKLPTYTTYKQFDLCHAGCFTNEWKTNEDMMLWSRDHFNHDWFKDRILIHGHTPLSYLREDVKDLDASGWYHNHTKLCIDCGTVRSHTIALFDLDNQTTNMIHV